ncbi:MAG: ubiquitin-like small modifier protein 1 [Thermodesulfobacteriota bacterium]
MAAGVSVQVDFYGAVQQVFGDKSTRVSVGPAPTVRAVLERLCTTAERRGKIFDPSGGLRPEVTVMKNGRNVLFLNGLETEVSEGDVVALFPPTFGG